MKVASVIAPSPGLILDDGPDLESVPGYQVRARPHLAQHAILSLWDDCRSVGVEGQARALLDEHRLK